MTEEKSCGKNESDVYWFILNSQKHSNCLSIIKLGTVFTTFIDVFHPELGGKKYL